MRFIIAICVAGLLGLPYIGTEPKTAGLIMAFTVGGACIIYLIELVIHRLRNVQEKRENKTFSERMDAERRAREAKDPDIYTRMDAETIPF